MIDLISAIEELSEMLKESESFILQCKAQDGGPELVPIGAMFTSGGEHPH